MKKTIFGFLGIISALPAMALELSGTVFDEYGPAAGVAIRIKDASYFIAETDENGDFKIFDSTGVKSTDKLSFEMQGLETLVLPATQAQGNITMKMESQQLDDVLVTECNINETRKMMGIKAMTVIDDKCYPTECMDDWTLKGSGKNAKCDPKPCECGEVFDSTAYGCRPWTNAEKTCTDKTKIKRPANANGAQLRCDESNKPYCHVLGCITGYEVSDDGKKCVKVHGTPCTAADFESEHARDTNAKTYRWELLAGRSKTCLIDTCNKNYEPNDDGTKCEQTSGTCESGDKNAKKTALETRDGKKVCIIKSCVDGYMVSNDALSCERSEGKCTEDQLKAIPHATAGELKDGKCYATECADGFDLSGGQCVAIGGDCSPMPENAQSAHREYNAETKTEICIIDRCNKDYNISEDKLSCVYYLSQEESQARVDELRDNAQAMKDKEQSLANRTLGAAAIGATGIGGMMAMSALSEQQSDADAERDMAAYLKTFRCDFGGGQRIAGGEQNVELPGANELMPLYSEYIALANDLKIRKNALGMRAGIESETILDQATTGLYDDIGTGKTSGMYVSLAAALSGDVDALAAWDAQKAKTAENLKTGLTTAGIGAAVGLVGNAIINSKSAKNKADEILARYEMQRVQDVHENIVLKNTVTEPIVIDDSTDEKTQDLISSIVPTLETEDAPESDDKTGASGMKDTKIAEIKDVLTQLSDGSNKDYIIIAEDELFDGTRLKDTGKKKLDDIWAGMTGRACMFQFDIYEPIGNLTQTNFNKSYARRKALEEYVVSKQYSPSIQVDFVSADVSSGRCSNEEPPCPYLWVKLKCIQDKDILVADAGQTAWLPLNIKHPIDDAGLDGTIYQSATRGEYSDYLGRAERVCVKAGGKWKDDIKIYTVLENTQGTYNTYFDATCDFGKPDRTSGSKRCANMCRQADVECTQSGNMGYDNYTSCFIYPPQD